MAGAERQGPLFSEPVDSDGTVVVNDRCLLRTAHGFRVVIVSGVVLAQYAIADRMAETYAMVNLVEQGWAAQKEVARAFGCSGRSVRRHQGRFHIGGLAALGRADGYPPGRRRLSRSREQLVRRLKAQGVANREIARRLGVTPKAVRKLSAALQQSPSPRETSARPVRLLLPQRAAASGPAAARFPWFRSRLQTQRRSAGTAQ